LECGWQLCRHSLLLVGTPFNAITSKSDSGSSAK
jgi:hypothetical protein